MAECYEAFVAVDQDARTILEVSQNGTGKVRFYMSTKSDQEDGLSIIVSHEDIASLARFLVRKGVIDTSMHHVFALPIAGVDDAQLPFGRVVRGDKD